jgi:hypothetical protein
VDPDQGTLAITRYELAAPVPGTAPSTPSTPVAQARAAAASIVRELQGAIAPGAMSVDSRSLSDPATSPQASRTRTEIRNIVQSYQAAVQGGSVAEAAEIASDWADLRVTIYDVFRDDPQRKTIYGSPDNYAPWRYARIFEQSHAVVAIGEPGQNRSLCSGVLIAADLVLTAAHCFAGPPVRDPGTLEVWFDYRERPDGTFTTVQRRRLVGPVAPPATVWPRLLAGDYGPDLLDYAVVRFAPSSEGVLVPNGVLPQCLRRTSLHRGDAIYVVGYPQGGLATVHDNARVYLPHRIPDGEDYYQLRLNVEADVLDRPDKAEIMREFDESYQRIEGTLVRWRLLYNVADRGQPRMGIVADAFRGNSGGPVFDHEREQCVVGILNSGTTDTGERLRPDWKRHERVLPVNAILDDLRRHALPLVDALLIR